ncbi:hypothetical protein BDZ97DRAFT_1808872, partial [Flammula alnicola]
TYKLRVALCGEARFAMRHPMPPGHTSFSRLSPHMDLELSPVHTRHRPIHNFHGPRSTN